ncbi:phosphatase PAP2 family protein [Nocardioides sp. MAHUQ-72]|uniref:phosphatase PAP2 family protein n=1 Tax=unclassified Nocardioides TaxID=2615069 RepID=UPI00361C1E5F
MSRPEDEAAGPGRRAGTTHRWLADARRVDQAVYTAVARTPTPALDRSMSRLSRAADRSGLWLATAGVLAVVGGRSGRRAAAEGLVCVAVSSAVVNLGVKRLGGRARPDREGAQVPLDRHVTMPTSLSFPSGHSASAFAFATGAGTRLPVVTVPLHGLAGVVAYSRVHTGVHFPGDVLVGSLLGTVIAQLTTRLTGRAAGRYAASRG